MVQDDPRAAARDLCNKHVCKMVLESAQLLSGVGHLRGISGAPYRPTHLGHPCTSWAASSPANCSWLLEHAQELMLEYQRRYGRVHASGRAIEWAVGSLPLADWRDHTAFVQAMPQEYRRPDAVAAYRAYYIGEKRRFARWAPRAVPPSWWPTVDVEG